MNVFMYGVFNKSKKDGGFMEKIKTYKVGKKGNRGLTITVPKVWSYDHNIKSGDVISVYRSQIEGEDVLILMKKETFK